MNQNYRVLKPAKSIFQSGLSVDVVIRFTLVLVKSEPRFLTIGLGMCVSFELELTIDYIAACRNDGDKVVVTGHQAGQNSSKSATEGADFIYESTADTCVKFL